MAHVMTELSDQIQAHLQWLMDEGARAWDAQACANTKQAQAFHSGELAAFGLAAERLGVTVSAGDVTRCCLISACPDYGDPDFGEGTCPSWHANMAHHDHSPVRDLDFKSREGRQVAMCACHRLIVHSEDTRSSGWARLRGKP